MRKLTEEEIANFPHKNVIVRALGMKEVGQGRRQARPPAPGDIFLLCSDGLSGPVPDPELLRIVEENKNDLKAAASRLIARANENGGPDNITCCLVRWD
jgi:serine/threonine protein phosphatase PrpC